MNSSATALFSILFLAFVAKPLHAIEVYQWTDENGVVHFSQWAPDNEQGDVKSVRVEGGEGAENGLGISEEDDPEGYLAHREQMDALRADMEARREAERARQAQASRTEYIYLQPENNYPYAFPAYGYRPPHRPPNRPKPEPYPSIEKPPTSVLRPLTQRQR